MIANDIIGLLGPMKGAKFANIVYKAQLPKEGTGEKARMHCIIGATTEELYKKDIAVLADYIPTAEGLHLLAAQALLQSRQESLIVGVGHNSQYVHGPAQGDTFTFPMGVNGGIKVHKETGKVYLNVLVQKKEVLEEGVYKVVKSSPETLAKNAVRALLPSSRFRTLIVNRVIKCAAMGKHLEADAVEIFASASESF